MALSTTIIKKSVTFAGEGKFTVTANLLYKNGETVLLDLDFSETYKTGQAWSTMTTNFRDRMKAAIRHYKGEQQILNAPGLDAGILNLNSSVGV